MINRPAPRRAWGFELPLLRMPKELAFDLIAYCIREARSEPLVRAVASAVLEVDVQEARIEKDEHGDTRDLRIVVPCQDAARLVALMPEARVLPPPAPTFAALRMPLGSGTPVGDKGRSR